MISVIKGRLLNYLWTRINEMPDLFVEWWQTYRFNKILKVSIGLDGMYKDIINKAGIKNPEIKTLSDLEKLPVVTRSLIEEYPYSKIANNKNSRYNFYSRSIANSICRDDGKPFKYIVDKKFCVVRSKLANNVAFQNIDPKKDRSIFIGKFLSSYLEGPNCLMIPYSVLKNRKQDFFKIFSGSRSDYVFFDNINIMNSFKALCLDYQLRSSLNLKSIILFSTGISDKERSENEIFFNVPIFLAKYSLFEEAPFLGWECEKRRGFHLNRQSYILEIVDENGKRVLSGHLGRIVITNFENEIMPLIRYDTGERGYFLDKPCNCGHFSPLFMIELPKVRNIIMTDRIIHYTDLQDVFSYYHGAIRKFEAFANSNNVIQINILPGKIWSNDLINYLEGSLKDVVGPNTQIDFNIINS